MISHTAFILVSKTANRDKIRIVAVCHSVIKSDNMCMATAAISATEAAFTISKKSLSVLYLCIKCSKRYRKIDIKNEGRNIAMVAITAPAVPLIRYPANVALDKMGP